MMDANYMPIFFIPNLILKISQKQSVGLSFSTYKGNLINLAPNQCQVLRRKFRKDIFALNYHHF